MKFKTVFLRMVGFIVSHGLYTYYIFRWKKPAKPEKIIWIKPNDIERSIEFSDIVQQRRYYLNGVILNGEWGRDDYTVYKIHSPLFNAFKEKFSEKNSFADTEYFNRLNLTVNELKRKVKTYDRKYSAIYECIKKEGFHIPNSVFDEMDTFKVSIASNGDFLFMTGKHRLAIAKLMGDAFKIPVKVSHRHYDWQKYRDELFLDYQDGNISKEKIKKIDHPDLLDIIGE